MIQSAVKVIYYTGYSLIEKKCFLRASALTFSTLLSIVPLLALMFSVAKGFGVQTKLKPFVISKLAAGMQDVAEKIISYVDNTDAKALGTAGLLLLIFSAINVLGNIETSFNDIWEISKSRSFYRKFSDYLSVLLIGPILIIAATSITATLSNNTMMMQIMKFGFVKQSYVLFINLAPLLSLWIAFSTVYIFLPNTKVHIIPALIGGIFSGSLWQFSQWIYIYFQIGVSRYNAIYGTFASAPIFMIWIYINWIIVLIGAHLAFVYQNRNIYIKKLSSPGPVSFESKELIGLLIIKVLSKNFYGEGEKITSKIIADIYTLPIFCVEEVLLILCRAGILTEVKSIDENYYLPSRSPELIKISDVLCAIKKSGENVMNLDFLSKKDNDILHLLRKLDDVRNNVTGNTNLKDFYNKT